MTTAKPKPLYRITKERWDAEYDFRTRTYTDTRKRVKREVIITDRKGRVTQCVAYAKRANASGKTSSLPRTPGVQYKVFVEISNDPVEFTAYAEES